MKRKTSEIIPRLHELSKELREMRHLFENYRNLIKKIMATTRPDGATGEYPWNLSAARSSLALTSSPDLAGPGRRHTSLTDVFEEPRVVLVKSAMDRFDRLADRLLGLREGEIHGVRAPSVKAALAPSQRPDPSPVALAP